MSHVYMANGTYSPGYLSGLLDASGSIQGKRYPVSNPMNLAPLWIGQIHMRRDRSSGSHLGP